MPAQQVDEAVGDEVVADGAGEQGADEEPAGDTSDQSAEGEGDGAEAEAEGAPTPVVAADEADDEAAGTEDEQAADEQAADEQAADEQAEPASDEVAAAGHDAGAVEGFGDAGDDEPAESDPADDEAAESDDPADDEAAESDDPAGDDEASDGDATGGIVDGWLEGLDSGAGRCDGDQTYALAEIFLAQGYDRRFIMQGDVRVVDLTTALEAGEYTFDTYSWDEHPNRPYDTPQASERYYVELIDADGNVVGSTGATTDLPDDVVRGESYDTFEVTLTGTAVQMRIIHIQDYITTGSVVPGCLSVSAVVDIEPEPEPEPPTTVPTPPTTTPPIPPATTPPTTTPPTTAAPTTTQPAVGVADETATLPYTGSNTIGLTVVGGSLIVAGLGFTIISRRRLGAIA
ncbi:MAG: LPXTG cell wall anchor domain-containing protein [Actinomycetota bacterium]|nr:LPXTG cell wall anchor domain-containing protein [Actinomycetota bacterium]